MGRPSTIADEMPDVGGSVLHVRRDAAGRSQVIASSLTRRYDMNSSMSVSGPALQHVRGLTGTMANCSGGVTPRNTVLTCETARTACASAR
jgi:secreted PhoX family phosphatase